MKQIHKKYGIPLLALVLLLCVTAGSAFAIQKKNAIYLEDLYFLKGYGDIGSSLDPDNSLALGFVVTDALKHKVDTAVAPGVVRKEEIQFNNKHIMITDYEFADSGIRYRNASLYYLNLHYVIKENSQRSAYPFEVTQLEIADAVYDIGQLYFFPQSYEEGPLLIGSVTAMSMGAGIKDFFCEVKNSSDHTLHIQSIDPRHFEIENIHVEDEAYHVMQSGTDQTFAIEQNEIRTIVISFPKDSDLTQYDTFYVTPQFVYQAEKAEYILYFNYYNCGLQLEKSDLQALLETRGLV